MLEVNHEYKNYIAYLSLGVLSITQPFSPYPKVMVQTRFLYFFVVLVFSVWYTSTDLTNTVC